MNLKVVPIVVVTRQQFEQENLYNFGELQENVVYRLTYEGIIQFPLLQDLPVFLEDKCVGLARVIAIHQFPLRGVTTIEYCLSQDLSEDQKALMTDIFFDLKSQFSKTTEKGLPTAKKSPRPQPRN